MNVLTDSANDKPSDWTPPKPVNHWGPRALAKPDPLARAKNHLNDALQDLSFYKRYRIKQEIKRLEQGLVHKDADVSALVTQFTQQCDNILQNKHSKTKRAVYTVAASVIVTALAALIGFGIGFAAGYWMGPGAFISGFMAGSKAACATAAITGLAGITAGYSTFQFFSKHQETKVATTGLTPKQAINNFTEQVSLKAGAPA